MTVFPPDTPRARTRNSNLYPTPQYSSSLHFNIISTVVVLAPVSMKCGGGLNTDMRCEKRNQSGAVKINTPARRLAISRTLLTPQPLRQCESDRITHMCAVLRSESRQLPAPPSVRNPGIADYARHSASPLHNCTHPLLHLLPATSTHTTGYQLKRTAVLRGEPTVDHLAFVPFLCHSTLHTAKKEQLFGRISFRYRISYANLGGTAW
jgi:hypothetical protein